MKDLITDVLQFAERASEIDLEENRKLAFEIINELRSTMIANNLQALAAPQIGYPYRILCVKFNSKSNKNDIKHYINPIISAAKGFALVRERYDVLPGREFIHPRNAEINMMYQTLDNGSMASTFVGATALVLQEYVDLLDGMTLETIGLEIDERFDQATEEEKNELLEAYAEEINAYYKSLTEEIKNDPDLMAVSNAAEFMSSMAAGEVKLKRDLVVEKPAEEAKEEESPSNKEGEDK